MFFNLITAIRVRGLRSYEVARSAGIRESHLSMAIHGRAELGPQARRRIAELLQVDERWLFSQSISLPGPRSMGYPSRSGKGPT